jgi:hypothetical protein
MQYIYLNARKDAQDFTKLALILLPRIVLGSIVCPSLFVSGWSVNGCTAGHSWLPPDALPHWTRPSRVPHRPSHVLDRGNPELPLRRSPFSPVSPCSFPSFPVPAHGHGVRHVPANTRTEAKLPYIYLFIYKLWKFMSNKIQLGQKWIEFCWNPLNQHFNVMHSNLVDSMSCIQILLIHDIPVYKYHYRKLWYIHRLQPRNLPMKLTNLG